MTEYYIRVGTHPEEDLERGYSYSMGAFGDEEEAHEGLSGYRVWLDGGGLGDGVERLDDRMGVTGDHGHRLQKDETPSDGEYIIDVCGHPFLVSPTYVTLYEGSGVGTGPDGEDLFAPIRIVASWDTREIESPAHLEELISGEVK